MKLREAPLGVACSAGSCARRWAVHEALRCMFRYVVRCNSLVRVEKVQEGLLAEAGSSFFARWQPL